VTQVEGVDIETTLKLVVSDSVTSTEMSEIMFCVYNEVTLIYK